MIKIFDSHLGKKVEFKPLIEGHIGMYVCGPTVYDSAHLGHGRSAVSFDVIRRYFEYRGYKVKYVSNYTDIDDKMIKRAHEDGCSVEELAERVIPEYERDYGKLGVKVPDVQPKATDHIEEMIEMIKRLEKEGYTYVLDDGVYFDVAKYQDYGKLSGQDLEALQMGARVEVKDEKRNPQDFVLWKLKKEGEPFWASPWGDGRPGWHIECSAMTWKHLGEKFDIHGGGLDLLFPHHECENAQSLCTFGAGTFAQHWMHNGFINVDNEKMSKSLGNFFTLKDIFEKYDPQVVRLMFLQTHYRNPVNFSDALLDQSKAALARIHDFVRALRGGNFVDTESGEAAPELSGTETDIVTRARERFEHCMDDDFDTSGALGALFEMIREVNATGAVSVSDLNEFLQKIDSVLGVIFFEEGQLDEEVENLIKERDEARTGKNYKRADEIRDELSKRGIALEDKDGKTVWKKI